MNRPILASILVVPALLFFLFSNEKQEQGAPPAALDESLPDTRTITGEVGSHDTLELIFKRHNLSMTDMYHLHDRSKDVYDLSMLSVGNIYTITLDRDESSVQNLTYAIDDSSYLSVDRDESGYSAEEVSLPVIKRRGSLHLTISDNLVSSMPGNHREYLKLALTLSDIYAWDIDFASDIRKGDQVKLIIEEMWVGSVFKGYGDILAAEFINDGKVHRAYRFEHDGTGDYYDEEGKALRKALLRSPLKFKYISSGYSRRRLHPVLRTYRPHLGIDYAAPTGTPVSAAGNGKVTFAGFKGQMGRMVTIRHPGGFVTYYGHLSRINKKIRKGRTVSQGEIIGYVGSTGLSTGPHLDYRIKYRKRFVNPLTIKLPRGKSVPKRQMAQFRATADHFEELLLTIEGPVMAYQGHTGQSG